MSHSEICWKCRRSITPSQRLEKDPKTRKTWLIFACPYERCAANLDLREQTIKLWNDTKGFFESDI
jgi:hypothetical protein